MRRNKILHLDEWTNIKEGNRKFFFIHKEQEQKTISIEYRIW